MTDNIRYTDQIPDIDPFFTIYKSTGWNADGTKDKKLLAQAIQNSWYFVSAYADEQLIGTGRIISDGFLHALITEVIVLPDYQRKGIGQQIVHRLVRQALSRGIDDIQLFCAQGKEEFYIHNGFGKRPADAPGMQYQKM